MKALFIAIAYAAAVSYAGEYDIVEKVFKASHKQTGESFVAVVAYDKAVEKASREGYSCSRQYRYNAYQTFTGKWKAEVEVICHAMIYKTLPALTN